MWICGPDVLNQTCKGCQVFLVTTSYLVTAQVVEDTRDKQLLCRSGGLACIYPYKYLPRSGAGVKWRQ